MKHSPKTTLEIIVGDALRELRRLPDESVQCVVTSPPYYALRDYGIEPTKWPAVRYQPMTGAKMNSAKAQVACLGLEATPEDFIAHLILLFREVRRVLRADGVAWVNLGDNYSARPTGSHGFDDGRKKWEGRESAKNAKNRVSLRNSVPEKNLMGMPWRFALAAQADGWILRSETIWNKPNPSPETIHDRPSKAHEQIFLLAKSPRYFYDKAAAREPVSGTANPRGKGLNPKAAAVSKTPDSWDTSTDAGRHGTVHRTGRERGRLVPRNNEQYSAAITALVELRNWRDVWTIPSEPYKGAHFATFPTALPRRCIVATTRPGDVVLDFFAGSGTTGAVALELGRSAVLIEKSPTYADLARRRCESITPGFALEFDQDPGTPDDEELLFNPDLFTPDHVTA